MNAQEFKTFWDECFIPTFNDIKKTDNTLYIRDGSMDSLCREYNEIKNFVKRAFMYSEICKHGFAFPETIMNVDYKSSVCWAWHHNAIDGYFDILGNANLFFMIENYSIAVYENKNIS